MQIKYDAERRAIFAEWPDIGYKLEADTWLTYPISAPPESAWAASASVLDPAQFYQVGYPEPYDAGDIGGDTQIGAAYTRRWATWHGPDHGWLVVDLAAYLTEDPAYLAEGNGIRVMEQQARVYYCDSLHDAGEARHEETYYWARHAGKGLADDYVRQHVASYEESDANWATDDYPHLAQF